MEFKNIKTAYVSIMILQLAILSSFSVNSSTVRANENSIGTIAISSGSDGGSYNRFLQLVDSVNPDIKLLLVSSEGSVQNLDRLVNGEVDFAVLQSDMIYESYVSSGSLSSQIRAAMPLFDSYVQAIVRKGSNIELLRDFEGKKISLGLKQSGTYKNASDFMNVAGLTSGIDFIELPMGSGQGIEALMNDELDIVFVSGGYRDFDDSDILRQFPLPVSILNNLSNREAFYKVAESPGDFPSLSLTIYLATLKGADDEIVERVVSNLASYWPLVQISWSGASVLDETLAYEPFPFHRAAINAYEDLEILSEEPNYLGLVIGASLVIFLVSLLSKFRSTYNRVGSLDYKTTPNQRVINSITRWGTPIMVAASVILALSAFVWLIQLSEQSYARVNNTENLFSRIPFGDALIWIFTFIVSGYPDIVFPSSPMGKFLVAAFALLGLLLPFGTAFGIFSVFTEYRNKLKTGRLDFSSLSGHVVICGWNSRVPRVIYTLTGSDAPVKKEVVVLANPSESEPFQPYGFTGGVRFCRGEPSNRLALERAGVCQANHIIIVPTAERRDEGNLDNALAAISARSLNPKVTITIEMEHKENEAYFNSANCDIVVDPEIISRRLLALSTVNEYCVDFVLDVLTFDEYEEWYCYRLRSLKKFPGWKNMQLPCAIDDVFLRSRAANVPAVGVVYGTERDRGIMNSSFLVNTRISAALTRDELQGELGELDAIIIAAKDASQIENARPQANLAVLPDIENQELSIRETVLGDMVVIVGPGHRCDSLADLLLGRFGIADILIIDTDKEKKDADGIMLGKVRTQKISTFYFLGFSNLHEVSKSNRAFRRDAETIVRAKLVREELKLQGHEAKLIAELNVLENRKNFEDAGIDSIVPYGLVCERILTKTVYGKGDVSDFVLALITTEDGVGIFEHIVDKRSPFLHICFSQVLGLRVGLSRIIGIKPQNSHEELFDEGDYFEQHFILSGQGRESDVLSEGDILILMTNLDKNVQ